MRRLFPNLILTTGLAALLALAGCKASRPAPAGGSAASAEKAPPEANTVIPNLDGTSTAVGQYKGKVVLVNFWATWCKPCQVEIPWLIQLNDKYKDQGLVILGIAVDDDGKKVVEPYVKSHRFDVNGKPELMNYPILLGTDAIEDKFGGILGLPTSMLYARDGRKVKTFVGMVQSYDLLAKTLEQQF